MPLTHAPIETVEPVDCQADQSDERIECPVCYKRYLGAVVVSEYVGIDHHTHHFQASRALYCDHCDAVFTWFERVEPRCRDNVDTKLTNGQHLSLEDFTLTGHVLHWPVRTRDRQKVARFLSLHPEAAGVSQS